jgi:hypothetical protein
MSDTRKLENLNYFGLISTDTLHSDCPQSLSACSPTLEYNKGSTWLLGYASHFGSINEL